ncbi:hypothetical protein MMC30_002043 [Trapelia coarctata]|nr:hypothetical protein [Trapelia coarctata]
MGEPPAEEGLKLPERRKRADEITLGANNDIKSLLDAVTSKMVCSDSKLASSNVASHSSDTIPPGTSKPSDGGWTNRCALCNGLSSPHHSSSACCLVCRYYSDIDHVVEKWKAKNILAIKLPHGETFETILRSEQKRTKALRRKEAELRRVTESKRKKANSLQGPLKEAHNRAQMAQDKYNRIVEDNPYVFPESTAAKAEYDTTKAKFDNLTNSFEAAKVSFEKAARDYGAVQEVLDKQADARAHITDELAARLLYLAGVRPTDQIGRARLFFSWVANSLRYDRVAHDQRPPDERTPIDTMLNQSEVCHGFANLFNTMFNSGKDPDGPDGSVYISGYTKNGDFRSPATESSHAWNAFPVGDGTWKVIDPTWACGAVYNEAGHEAFDPTWFTKSNEELLRTHIPENEEYQFRDNRQLTMESAQLWETDLVDCTLQSRVYRINEASIKPSHRTIKVPSPSRTVFKFKKSCTHYDGRYHCFIIWVGAAPKNGKMVTIDTNDLIFVPPLLDGSGWRVSTKLPIDGNSAILFALLSDGQPAQVKGLDEWKRMDTKRTYAMVARWDLKATG